MKCKRLFTGVLSVAILASVSSTAFAGGKENFHTVNFIKLLRKIIPISRQVNEKKITYFNSFTGKVKKITDYEAVKGSKSILVEGLDQGEANIIISKDTYIVNNEEIEEGSVITGFYDSSKPMIMIYPPQYNAEVVAVYKQGESVKVDKFDKNLVSFDKSLKLNISKDTKIMSQDGKAFKGELTNRKLVVIYGVATKSFPAQTSPIKIIVLDEKPA